MRLIELFSREATELNVKAKVKEEIIDKLVDLQATHGNITDKAAYMQAIFDREAEFSTCVGNGIVVPHARTGVVTAPSLAVARLAEPIQYNEEDDEKSDLFFMIAAPMNGSLHVDVLARLMTLLAEDTLVDKLRAAKTEEEFLDLLDKAEQENFGSESFTEEPVAKGGFRILAVTACPTGIAHTYMAAEALQKAGEAMGINIKVETNGSGGAKNVLTAQEIADCDGIIIAADKSVDTARFDGKPVFSTKVADGIHKPEELINKIINGEAPVFHSDKKADASAAAAGDNESFGRKLYKHLMNGVSHMLPFVVAGGIFIALAFLIDAAAGVKGGSDFGSVTPVAAWFKTIGGYAFNFMLPLLAGFIAMSIADRPGLLVGFVGGTLAANGATFAAPGGAVPSGFLGALLAGFIGGWLMKQCMKLCDKMPRSLEGIKPVLVFPLAGLGIIGVMMCAVNPIMGVINNGMNNALQSLADNNLGILLGAILAGMMAIDMGGPFNKAAYVFGAGMLANVATNPNPETAYQIMASVMIVGMVPPIAIALSTTFFKKLWTEDERKSGPVNYIMGLSFITEGAIPYAASYPLQVIPSCIVGSAVAGALCWIFKCTLMAPHGGIFVLPTIGNWFMYFVALAIGSVLGMLMLAILKKPAKK